MASTWEDIDRSESYLVCSMYEEAAALSASVLRRVGGEGGKWVVGDVEVGEVMESAGMVLVQSLKEMGRSSEISRMLKELFSPVAIIPTEVLLTGVCLQILDGSSGIKELLEEFLGSWSYVDEKYYVHLTNEPKTNLSLSCDKRLLLEVEEYLKVVEVYVIIFLGKTVGDVDRSISWVEKTSMPEDKKQDLLRRLQSLYSLKTTASSAGFSSHLMDENEDPNLMQEEKFDGFPKSTESGYKKVSQNRRQEVLKLYSQVEPCFWLFRSVNLKFGNIRICISNGKILLGCLFLLAWMVLRRNRLNFNSYVKMQALALKNALVDFWRLAFSYQVNPLAAVQSLPSAANVRH
ncbi:hypothetical protein MLD38_006448 [Melastoma candidum]|uniref:Uncharacterized protein n=1 Tax=Melastoma candidum TaxID=119954 RepID=A0ACB9RMK4_9MYRT|nr:hypothetical protein MLD38_006448 [Melastoma candidum]